MNWTKEKVTNFVENKCGGCAFDLWGNFPFSARQLKRLEEMIEDDDNYNDSDLADKMYQFALSRTKQTEHCDILDGLRELIKSVDKTGVEIDWSSFADDNDIPTFHDLKVVCFTLTENGICIGTDTNGVLMDFNISRTKDGRFRDNCKHWVWTSELEYLYGELLAYNYICW